jgi:hypothetical protein
MVDPFLELIIADVTLQVHPVPVGFVEMPGQGYLRMLLTKPNGPSGSQFRLMPRLYSDRSSRANIFLTNLKIRAVSFKLDEQMMQGCIIVSMLFIM